MSDAPTGCHCSIPAMCAGAEWKARAEKAEAERNIVVDAACLLIDEIGLTIPDEPQEFDATNFWNAFAKLNRALADDLPDRARKIAALVEAAVEWSKQAGRLPDESDFKLGAAIEAYLDALREDALSSIPTPEDADG